MKLNRENILSSNLENEHNKEQKEFIKSKTLHELLKQAGGKNIVIDFSMLSKKGKLSSLVEKSKNYQNLNHQKIIDEKISDKNKENEDINSRASKTSQNFEILKNDKNVNLYNNIKNKENININEQIRKNYNRDNEKGIINGLKNRKNLKRKHTDNMYETVNSFPCCLELDYDNRNQSIYPSRKVLNKYKNNLYHKEKKNYNIYNKNYLPNNSKSQDKKNPILTKYLNYTYNPPNELTQNNKKLFNIRRPFVIESKNNKNKGQKQIIQNQAIEYETIKENYSIKHCNCVLEYSFREDQNIDSEKLMEDKSKSIENFNNDKNQMIFEIFDGHGGDEMSSYLQNNLAQIYKQNLLLNNGNIILSLKNAFHDADDEMRNQLNIEGLGSTGTLVHIKWESENDLVVYSANIGDSRVSLISPENIVRLSYDHRTNDKKERKRILESGLQIIDERINGTLMLTRIFGNYEYKNKEENDEESIINKKGLICEPFISKINIDLNIENQFLIIASDGIWDVLSEEDIRHIIINHHDTQQICSISIKNSLRREAWDNMSIFAVKLS